MFNEKVYKSIIENPAKIGKKLEELREKGHLSQSDMAVKLDLCNPNPKFDRNKIYRYETGKCLSVDILLTYCLFFKMDLEELLSPQPLTDYEKLKKVYNLLPANDKEKLLKTAEAWL